MKAFLAGAALAVAAWPSAALADWYKASSDHFVVYARDRESDLRTFSERLERFHAAMALVLGSEVDTPSPSNRVTIFVVRSDKEVRRLYQDGASKYLNGFYVPRAGKSFAIVPTITSTSKEPDISMITLMHEYAHHFLRSEQGYQAPRWVSEGSAEFFASSTFLSDGGIQLGRAAQHRGGELFFAGDVPVEELLDPAVYEANRRKGYDAFYGKSWLLYHYLTFSKERAGQLKRYLVRLAQGADERSAAEEVFGDFGALDKELDHYLHQRRIFSFRLAPEQIRTGPVTITPLSAGEAEILPLRIETQRGVDSEEAAEVVAEARTIAQTYPDDPAVLAELAEAEFDNGDPDAAIAAADRALAIDPHRVNAYLQKGYALFAKAEDADSKDMARAYAAARKPFLALNRIENDHPLPLIYYYRSFQQQGVKPPQVAVDGLVRASELAPFDLTLQMNVGMTLISLGHAAEARRHLQPVAYNPHGGGSARGALALLKRLDSEPEWDGRDMGLVLAAAESAPRVEASETGAQDDGEDGEAGGASAAKEREGAPAA